MPRVPICHGPRTLQSCEKENVGDAALSVDVCMMEACGWRRLANVQMLVESIAFSASI